MKVLRWVILGIVIVLAMLSVSYFLIFGSNKVGFLSFNRQLKWSVEKEEVAKLEDYYLWRNGTERVLFVLSDKLEVHPGEAVGMGLGREVYYAKRKKYGSVMVISVYINQEEYTQLGQVMGDRLIGSLVNSQLQRGVGISKENESEVFKMTFKRDYYYVGLEGR